MASDPSSFQSPFTEEETVLVEGTFDQVEAFIDPDQCLMLDWRNGETDLLDEVEHFLPSGSFEYDIDEHDDGSVVLQVEFAGRMRDFEIRPDLPDSMRILPCLPEILGPEYELALFRCTEGDDTLGFLLRPAAWWASFRAARPGRFEEIFRSPVEYVAMQREAL